MYTIEFMCGDQVCTTKRVARWELVSKVVSNLLKNPMYTAVQIKGK